MLVKATRLGYYRCQRRPKGYKFLLVPVPKRDKNGEQLKDKNGKLLFVSAEEQFSKNWMEKVKEKEPVTETKNESKPGNETGSKTVI